MFTETYIEMVTKAKEIQNLCKYKEGDWFYFDKFDWEIMRDGDNKNWYKNNGKWLPTLEDLIWMIDKDIEESNLEDFMMWCRLFVTPENIKENALEYIMEVHYSKEWNPEKKEWEERYGS